MKKGFLVQTIKKHCRRLQKQQALVCKGFNAEANHDFRVEIKKLRACLRLLHSKPKTKGETKIPARLRAFYRSVGELRSLQLQQEMVRAICQDLHCAEPILYLTLLHTKEKTAARKIENKAKAAALTHFCRRLQNSLPHHFDTDDVKRYVEERRVQLLALLSAPPLPDDTLHSIRKLMKDLLYVWPLVETVLTKLLPGSLSRKEYYLQLTEALGKFQDYCTALTLFSPDYRTTPGADEQERLRNIQQECLRRKAAQKRSVSEMLLTLWLDLQASPSQETAHPVLEP